MNEINETLFEIKGGFDISKKLKPLHGADGDIIGYETSEGHIIRLVVGLEIENTKTNQFSYITSEDAMSILGFKSLDYSDLTFLPQ
jgi:hypothetical protein